MNELQPVLLETEQGAGGTGTSIPGVDNEDITITFTGTNCEATFHLLGIRLVMSWHGKYMNYDVYVPEEYCQNTQGHLGTCDGNPGNDQPPNNFICEFYLTLQSLFRHLGLLAYQLFFPQSDDALI